MTGTELINIFYRTSRPSIRIFEVVVEISQNFDGGSN